MASEISENDEAEPKSELHHIHLVSDSTGETLESLANAILSQFKEVEVARHVWPMVLTKPRIKKTIQEISETPGLVLFTMVNHEMRNIIVRECRAAGLPWLPALEPAIEAVEKHLGARAEGRPGLQHTLDEDYFGRIDAVHFTLAHDDGQNAVGLIEADIVLVGVSRTSKTPTSIYLANRGHKTANVPYVPDIPLPDQLFEAKDALVIGLTASPQRLVDVRSNRLRSLSEDRDTDYVDLERVKDETQACRKLCTKMGWPVVDVTRRSIEETAAAVMKHYHQLKEERDKAKKAAQEAIREAKRNGGE